MTSSCNLKLYLFPGVVILVLVMMAAGCTSNPSGPTPTTTVPTVPLTSPTSTQVTSATATATSFPTSIQSTPTTITTTPATTLTTAPNMGSISIQNFAFNPAAVTIPRTTKVTWTNLDATDHQIINDATGQAAQGALFMSNPLPRGATYSFTFTTAGTYPYHCNIHPSMKGTITVT